MDVMFIAVIVISAIILGGSFWYFLYYLSVNVWNPSGKGMDRKTTRTLKKFALLRSFKVLSDLDLAVDGKSVHVENMLIGFFGILLVHTCGARGEYYGKVDGETWTIRTDEGAKREQIPNPLVQQEQAEALLRTLFSRNNLYNMSIDHVVYLTSRSKKTGLFVTHNGQILLPGKLSAYLGKTKFEKDTGLDVEKVAQVVLSACQNQ